jgi:hypothetical protein
MLLRETAGDQLLRPDEVGGCVAIAKSRAMGSAFAVATTVPVRSGAETLAPQSPGKMTADGIGRYTLLWIAGDLYELSTLFGG